MDASGDVYEIACQQSFNSSTLYNVLHFQLKQGLTDGAASFATLAADIKECFRPVQSNSLTWVSWKASQVAGAGVSYNVTNCRRTGGNFYEANFTGTVVGGDSITGPGPSFEALVIALKSGFSGRSKRGQVYLGGLPLGAMKTNDTNHIDDARITSLTSNLATFYAKYKGPSGTSVDFNWVIFSRFIASGCKYVITNNKPTLTHVQAGDAVGCVVNVTSATPRTVISPMNRRKLGVGI